MNPTKKLLTLLFATSLLLALSFGTSCKRKSAAAKMEKADLFAENFEAFPDVFTERGDNNPAQALSNAMELYSRKEYTKAVTIFDELLLQDPSNDSLNFYSGVSLLASGSPNSAIIRFEDVMLTGTSSFILPSKWYTGLAYVSAGNKSKAASIFARLAEGKSSYSAKSVKMLEKLPDIDREFVEKSLNSTAIDLAKETFQLDESGFELYSYLELGPNKEIAIRASQYNQDLFVRYNKLYTEASSVKLFSRSGSLVYKKNYKGLTAGKEATVELNKFPAGSYNLEIKVDGTEINQKLLLQGAM